MSDEPSIVSHFLIVCRVVSCSCRESERIYPSMAFHPALMAFLHDEFQRVVCRRRAARASQVRRPRLIFRVIHGVAHRAHLKPDGVIVGFRKAVEQLGHLLLLLVSHSHRSALGFILWPVQSPHRSYPEAAQLAQRRSSQCRSADKQCQH